MAEHSRFVNFSVYLAVRIVVCVIQLMPYEAARRFARSLGWVVYRLDRRHRRVADENLRHAYGDAMTDEQRDATIRAVYVHFCTLLIELVHLSRRLHPRNWKRYAELISG